MHSLKSIPRPPLLGMAFFYAATLTLYTAVWLHYAGWSAPVQIGIDWKPEYAPYVTIAAVYPSSPASRAGLRPQDRILAVNGYPQHVLSNAPAIAHAKAGDTVSLRIQRPGVTEPFDVPVTVEAAEQREQPAAAKRLASDMLGFYPVPFLVVGLLVLFLRLEDGNAWLLALIFGGFIAAAPVAFLEGILTPVLRRFMLSYMLVLYAGLPAAYYWFFATFPAASPIDKKFPKLKFILAAISLAAGLLFAAMALVTGSSFLAIKVVSRIGENWWRPLTVVYIFGGFVLGVVSLIWNSLRATNPNDRRKARVMLWGTLASITPTLLNGSIATIQHKSFYSYPFWFYTIPILALWLLPISFAYAVVKHRVLEIPVLLKRSARYFLVQRGFLLLILAAGIAATLLLAHALERYFPERNRMAVPAGAALGIFMVWGGTQMESRVTRRLDRAFFRSAYDTRQILIDLVSKTRNASDRKQLAGLLHDEINDALHPSTLAIYFRQTGGDLITSADVPREMRRLPADLPVLKHMQQRGQSWEIVPTEGEAPALAPLLPLEPECLVPMQGRNGQLLGLAVLGPRLSEESYSGEDKRLLDSVASQAGIALENMDLAESMAQRLEAERRVRQEMDIARQVQSKLLPQKAPSLKTIEYAGTCIQARAVGGDYYDFLDLGEGRVGFVLADVAGKGISAALLMANLQAHLRSHSAVVIHDLSQTLEKVNGLFFESTEPNNYATMFLGVYEDEARRLRYVNCGHNPPLIVRGDQMERLNATTTVLGLFEDWHCTVAETCLQPGSILAICTDGVFEAANLQGEEFGEEGLIAALRNGRELSAPALLQSVITSITSFAPGEQADDLTLLILKAKEH